MKTEVYRDRATHAVGDDKGVMHFYCDLDTTYMMPVCGSAKPAHESGNDCPLCGLVVDEQTQCPFCGECH